MIYEVNQNDFIVLNVDMSKFDYAEAAEAIEKITQETGIHTIALPEGIRITDVIKKGDSYGW